MNAIAHAPFAELISHIEMTTRPFAQLTIQYGLLRSYCLNRKEFAQACRLAKGKGIKVIGLSDKEWRELEQL